MSTRVMSNGRGGRGGAFLRAGSTRRERLVRAWRAVGGKKAAEVYPPRWPRAQPAGSALLLFPSPCSSTTAMSASDVISGSPRWTLAAWTLVALVGCAPLAGASCAPDGPDGPDAPAEPSSSLPPDVPEGAVLLVAGIALTAAEVAPLARDILELYPEYSPVHAR